MAPKLDIGWEHAIPVGGDRKKCQCNYCGKIVHGGITRLKHHIAHISGNVEPCTKVPKEIRKMVKSLLNEGIKERAAALKKKESIINAVREENLYGDMPYTRGHSSDDDNEDGHGMSSLERHHLKQAMRESRYIAHMEEESRRNASGETSRSVHQQGGYYGGSSKESISGMKRGVSQTFGMKSGIEMPSTGFDPFMFPSANKTVKGMLNKEGIKKIGKAISKFFIFNALPFNAADSGPYMQSMIDTIGDVGGGVKGPSGYQIGGVYLNEEVDEIEKYINILKVKWPIYGCTIMCDGWSSRTKHPIINFMVYCDRTMIYHSSIDCTNKEKNAKFIFSLMDRVVEEIGEENIVHIVTDNESAYKAAGDMLMKKRKHLFWSPCAAHCIDLMLEDIGKMKSVKATVDKAKKITSFIYNSDKIVNLMKTFTKDRELLRPGITRFATEFIAIESLLRHQNGLKQLCTCDEWSAYNNTKKRKNEALEVSELILTERFWKKAREVCAVMEPLVRVLKAVDQDKKPTLCIIYEAMDRAKMAIQASVKNWEKYWEIIDERWYRQLHRHLHAAAYFLNPVLQYSNTCVYDTEVRRGVKEVIKRLEPDLIMQSNAMNEVNIFVDKLGEFGTPLARKAVFNSLPAQWWYDYGDEAPNLRKIAVKVLSQTCASSGCERNWSTWSLIHTKLRNRLAMEKLHKLVYAHYNMRLRVRNLMYKNQDDDFYNPIDLNHIFHDNDILDDWTREKEPPSMPDDDLDWMDKATHHSDEASDEDDDTTLPLSRWAIHKSSVKDKQKSSKEKSKQTLLRKKSEHLSSKGKNKHVLPSSSSEEHIEKRTTSSDDDGGGGGDDDDHDGGGCSGYKDTQQGDGSPWTQANDNYYATQDTDHGYRPGIENQRRFLENLTDFSSANDGIQSQRSSPRQNDIANYMQDLDIEHGQVESYGLTTTYGNRNVPYPIHVQGSSMSTNTSGNYDRPRRKTRESVSGGMTGVAGYHLGSSNSAGGSNQYSGPGSSPSSTSSTHYRGFGYYNQGRDHVGPPQPLPQAPYGLYQSVFPQFPYVLPSQPVMYFPYGIPSNAAGVINTGSSGAQFPPNYSPRQHAYYRRNDDDDGDSDHFEPHRQSSFF